MPGILMPTVGSARTEVVSSDSPDDTIARVGVAAQRPRARRALRWALSVAAVAGLAIVVIFLAGGGRWFIVESPSMGSTAPIGTLILDRPTTPSELRTGDIISFHPPTSPGEVYTHRIVGITAAGTVTTRGDINGASDPWTLTRSDIIGRTVAVLPVIGWLLRGVPLVLLGAIGLWLATGRVVNLTVRAALRVSGLSLVTAVVVFVLHPLVGIVLLAESATVSGARAVVVSTGILPIRVFARGGTSVHLDAGQVGHLTMPPPLVGNAYHLSSNLELPAIGWIIVAALCALPLFWSFVVGLPRPGNEETA